MISDIVLKLAIKKGFIPFFNVTPLDISDWLIRKHNIGVNITSQSLESFTVTITSPGRNIKLGDPKYKYEDFVSYNEAFQFGLMIAIKQIIKKPIKYAI